MNKPSFEDAIELTDNQKKKWDNLWEKSPDAHFFNSSGYFLSFIDAFEPRFRRIIFCYDRGELVAVLPLIQSKKFGIPVLACPDQAKNYLDRTSFLVSRNITQFIDQFTVHARKLGNIYLADCSDFISGAFCTSPTCFLEEAIKCPRGKIREDALANMSTKQKRNIRRRIRKNEDHLEFKYFTENLNQQFEIMIEIERDSEKPQKGIALFDHEDARKLYRSIIKASPRNVAVGMLYFDKQPIASAFGLICKNTFLCTHMAFRSKFRNLEPGKMLICFLLEELRKKGVQNFDFSKGDGRLKREFTDEFPAQHNIYFSNNILVMAWWKLVIEGKRSARFLRDRFVCMRTKTKR